VDLLSSSLSLVVLDGSLLLCLLASLHSVEEVLSASGGGDVLNTDVDALLEDAVSDLLVDFNTNGTL